ncbi:MAG TPA: hypothetical protein VF646_10670 [Cytophagales bacterium]|jgi:hypothetical protein
MTTGLASPQGAPATARFAQALETLRTSKKRKVDRLYFALWFRLDQTDGYLIWIQDDQDSVLVEVDLLIPVFRSESSLALYAKERSIEIVDEEPVLHDLDAIREWLSKPDQHIDCHEFLAAWNLFTDVSTGTERKFTGSKKDKLTSKLYDKLFFGNNLPAVTPPNEYYIPQWQEAERQRLFEVMTEGLQLFERSSKVIENKRPSA